MLRPPLPLEVERKRVLCPLLVDQTLAIFDSLFLDTNVGWSPSEGAFKIELLRLGICNPTGLISA
jgi:hypothetical protein